jgi:hypothetical protein
MSYKEFGKKCQSCGAKKESHMYWRKIYGKKGVDKNILKFRRICKECWEDESIKDYKEEIRDIK